MKILPGLGFWLILVLSELLFSLASIYYLVLVFTWIRILVGLGFTWIKILPGLGFWLD
jgi:hypothetical protein